MPNPNPDMHETDAMRDLRMVSSYLHSCGCRIHASGVDAAIDELSRLQAVVERLPKTKDGVPVVPGELVYAPTNIVPKRWLDAGWTIRGGYVATLTDGDSHKASFDYVADGDPPGSFSYWFPLVSDCYSTRAAAELAARQAEGDGDA